jgi:hypothetical protein
MRATDGSGRCRVFPLSPVRCYGVMTDTISPPGSPGHGRAVVAACLIAAGSAALGLAAGAAWAAAAPRVVYQVYYLSPPTAYAVNPETSAFIAADGWYCLLALIGGALIGLFGYLFGVRRYGPVPMLGVVAGATGAAFLMQWLGPRLSGQSGFNHLLATSKPGALLHAPISLGSHGALAFWPLAAAAVAGGIELVRVVRIRRQPGYSAAAVPRLDSAGSRPGAAEPGLPPTSPEPSGGPGQPAEGPSGGPVQPAEGPSGGPVQPAEGPSGGPAQPAAQPSGGPAQPAAQPSGGSAQPATEPCGGPDTSGSKSGRAAF